MERYRERLMLGRCVVGLKFGQKWPTYNCRLSYWEC